MFIFGYCGKKWLVKLLQSIDVEAVAVLFMGCIFWSGSILHNMHSCKP